MGISNIYAYLEFFFMIHFVGLLLKDGVNFTSIEVSTLPKTKPAKEITIT